MRIQRSPVIYVALAMLGSVLSASALDMPDVSQHYPSLVIAQANQAQTSPARKERAIGICYGVDHNRTGQENVDFLSPGFVAEEYFVLYENRPPDPWKVPSRDVELVVQPKHGKVEYIKHEDGLSYPAYVPSPGYVGDERIVFKVRVDGTTVRVVYLLKVTKVFTDAAGVHNSLCKKTGTRWRISLQDARTLRSHGAQL